MCAPGPVGFTRRPLHFDVQFRQHIWDSARGMAMARTDIRGPRHPRAGVGSAGEGARGEQGEAEDSGCCTATWPGRRTCLVENRVS